MKMSEKARERESKEKSKRGDIKDRASKIMTRDSVKSKTSKKITEKIGEISMQTCLSPTRNTKMHS